MTTEASETQGGPYVNAKRFSDSMKTSAEVSVMEFVDIRRLSWVSEERERINAISRPISALFPAGFLSEVER